MPHITRIRRIKVSTHSRLKAAGLFTFFINANVFGFNTQPPEGGWILNCSKWLFSLVSTHSRLKAAGLMVHNPVQAFFVSTHSRLKAAGKI